MTKRFGLSPLADSQCAPVPVIHSTVPIVHNVALLYTDAPGISAHTLKQAFSL